MFEFIKFNSPLFTFIANRFVLIFIFCIVTFDDNICITGNPGFAGSNIVFCPNNVIFLPCGFIIKFTKYTPGENTTTGIELLIAESIIPCICVLLNVLFITDILYAFCDIYYLWICITI